MPIRTRKRKKYMLRRSGFLHNGVLSCSNQCVTIRSEKPSWLPILKVTVCTLIFGFEKKKCRSLPDFLESFSMVGLEDWENKSRGRNVSSSNLKSYALHATGN
jgi:hypothetical protein